MTNEDFQTLVLEKLTNLEASLTQTNSRLDENTSRLDDVNARLDENTSRLDKLETGQKILTERIEEMREFQKTSLYETVQYINVRTERTENKLDALNERLFTQEAEIQGLKRIK